jgi:ADP-heptose:LPS heptosyltransferase
VTPSVGPVRSRLDNVRRIAVLRGGGLGDLMFLLPALWSLKQTYPLAELVLLGTPGHAALLADRPGPVDRVIRLPTATGVFQAQPGAVPDEAELDEFFRGARDERFDLAVQAHGGGRWSNPFLLRLGARTTLGTRTADADAVDRWLPYRYHQHEALRWLELVGLVGAPCAEVRARLSVTARDRAEADQALRGLPRPLVTVHPGATDPRRRWPADRFAEVATALVVDGAGVVVVGSADEAELVRRVRDDCLRQLPNRYHGSVRGLAGDLRLPGLIGVLAESAVVIANDSGPRHLADAVDTPTVSVFWCANMINAGPVGRARNRTHISWTVACPTCGSDLMPPDRTDCGHQDSWVAGVAVDDVLADVREFLDAVPYDDTGEALPASAGGVAVD